MYDHCFQHLSHSSKARLRPPESPLIGFAGQKLWPIGVVTLHLTLSDYMGKGSKIIMTEFMIIRAPSPYNMILGRPGMRRLGAISSTIHSLIKFPIQSGIAIVRGHISDKNERFQVSQKRERDSEMMFVPTTKENMNEGEGVVVNV